MSPRKFNRQTTDDDPAPQQAHTPTEKKIDVAQSATIAAVANKIVANNNKIVAWRTIVAEHIVAEHIVAEHIVAAPCFETDDNPRVGPMFDDTTTVAYSGTPTWVDDHPFIIFFMGHHLRQPRKIHDRATGRVRAVAVPRGHGAPVSQHAATDDRGHLRSTAWNACSSSCGAEARRWQFLGTACIVLDALADLRRTRISGGRQSIPRRRD
jgi:hypothetical protein